MHHGPGSGSSGIARRCVRGLGTCVFGGLLAAAPVLYFAAPHARTQASVLPPRRSWEMVTSGRYTKAWEKHLQESSPLTVQGRGLASEALYLLGLYDSERVHVGRDGWLFLRYGLDYNPAWWLNDQDRFAARRSRFLQALRQRAEAKDLRVLVLLVPDKDRIYPEKCWASGELPPAKRGLYGLLRRELADHGFAVVDGERAMLAAKAQAPDQLLFHPRDSHWTLHGAMVFAAAVRARIAELGWEELLGPELAYRRAPIDAAFDPDLVGMLGFRVGGALQQRLRHRHQGEVPVPPEPGFGLVQPSAGVALAGTSYSANGLTLALPLALSRRIDMRGVVEGRGPFPGLLQTLAAIESGQLRARLVLWEWPERCVLEGGEFESGEKWGWLYPPDLGAGR